MAESAIGYKERVSSPLLSFSPFVPQFSRPSAAILLYLTLYYYGLETFQIITAGEMYYVITEMSEISIGADYVSRLPIMPILVIIGPIMSTAD